MPTPGLLLHLEGLLRMAPRPLVLLPLLKVVHRPLAPMLTKTRVPTPHPPLEVPLTTPHLRLVLLLHLEADLVLSVVVITWHKVVRLHLEHNKVVTQPLRSVPTTATATPAQELHSATSQTLLRPLVLLGMRARQLHLVRPLRRRLLEEPMPHLVLLVGATKRMRELLHLEEETLPPMRLSVLVQVTTPPTLHSVLVETAVLPLVATLEPRTLLSVVATTTRALHSLEVTTVRMFLSEEATTPLPLVVVPMLPKTEHPRSATTTAAALHSVTMLPKTAPRPLVMHLETLVPLVLVAMLRMVPLHLEVNNRVDQTRSLKSPTPPSVAATTHPQVPLEEAVVELKEMLPLVATTTAATTTPSVDTTSRVEIHSVEAVEVVEATTMPLVVVEVEAVVDLVDLLLVVAIHSVEEAVVEAVEAAVAATMPLAVVEVDLVVGVPETRSEATTTQTTAEVDLEELDLEVLLLLLLPIHLVVVVVVVDLFLEVTTAVVEGHSPWVNEEVAVAVDAVGDDFSCPHNTLLCCSFLRERMCGL